MSYRETVRYLYGLQQHGIKFGLDNITRLLSELNNPHKSFLSVHVAGTNGKGSKSVMIASILQCAGLKVGLFTSPHLVSFTERIRINGLQITEGEVVQLAGEIKDIASRIDRFSPTFFEVVTAMALLYFGRQEIEAAVIEVGMGGRLDATNVIVPEVSVITNISCDHKEFLGETPGEIAYEKAGIVKEGVPVVSSRQEPETERVLMKRAEDQHTGLYQYGKDFTSVLTREDRSGIRFDYRSNSLAIPDVVLPLAGEHQMENASVSIRAAEIALRNAHVNRNSIADFIREGLKCVRWPGRLEFIREDPPIVIDGAHNPAAAVALSHALKNLFLPEYEKIIMVLGIMADKDIAGIMRPLLPLASEIILASPSYRRAASPEELAGIAASLGFPNTQTASSLREALETAIRIASFRKVPGRPGSSPVAGGPSSMILVTGSFYTIGEAKELLGQKGVLTRLRE
jgi:dihydrofolate synthase/folylpolyglutamate synthase